jgi:CBS domain-containing protein
MSVSDIMTEDLVTVSLGASLNEAVDRMLERRVGSVVVTDGDGATGIVTETDVLAAASYDRPLADIPVSRARSESVVTIDPDASLEAAVERMHDYGIKKLVVGEEADPVGIVTLTDLVYHRYELAQEAKQLDSVGADAED